MLTIQEAYTQAVRENVQRLREGERLLREADAVAGVHLMRTSSRRLRSAVRFLGVHLPRARQRRLERGLKRLMSAMAPVRDLDVLIEAIGRTPGIAEADVAKLRQAILRRRETAASRARVYLDGAEPRALIEDLEGTCGTGGDPAPRLAIAAPSRLMRAVEQTLRASPERWDGENDVALHDARKAVKRLRYALEAFQPGFGRPVARMIERCRELQEACGVVQDAAMFASRLRTLRSFAAGQALAHAQARAAEERARLARLWGRALGERMLGRLAGHLARRAARPPAPPPPVSLPAAPAPLAQVAS